MGKAKYNWKARRVVQTVIDNSDVNTIKLDFDAEGYYDTCNKLVLPSHKRKVKIKQDKSKVKLLSNKHRKQLEKIVERKKKKANRSALLQSLQQVQIDSEELSQFTSIISVQTSGLKRLSQNKSSLKSQEPNTDFSSIPGKKINSISNTKHRKLCHNNVNDIKNITSTPNVVGLNADSDEMSDSTDEEKEASKYGPAISQGDVVEPNKNSNMYKMEESNVQVVTASSKSCNKTINGIVSSTETKLNTKEIKNIQRQPTVYVDVIRDDEIQEARLKLPILAEEQYIIEVINENEIIIIAGETGSGKTTQVPQFLYEAGYALKKQICITEPRRVAAISMSQRVAEEMNLSTQIVSYLIRFEGNVTEETKIKFVTDGVLLKEIHSDFLLTKYSVIILDEAHERTVYTDILIGLLSRIVPLRKKKGDPLKLIIMSATLRVSDFTENQRLFKVAPPVINVESRQFPVTTHFNKRTVENYLKEAYSKVIKIHSKLPEGGILVFLTGQHEVNLLVKKLRITFPLNMKDKLIAEKERIEPNADYNNYPNDFDKNSKGTNKKRNNNQTHINLDDYSIPNDNESNSGEEDELFSDEEDLIGNSSVYHNAQPLWVLPLYSLLPSQKQQQVFKPPPIGYRLCIISTNIAETSLTIPNIKYVVDSGRAKIKLYDKVTGLTSYVVRWTSKASANQRAGRAGRTCPGHCYRLYSSAVFNNEFEDFATPEIQKRPVDDLYLQMKCMNIDKVTNFPFPTAPDLLQLKAAESRLEILGALRNNEVTSLGQSISKFPVLPRFGKMLALSNQHDLFSHTICLVAALSVQEVFLETPWSGSSEEKKQLRQKWASLRREWAGTGNSLLLGDNGVLLRAIGAAEYANSQGKLKEFCQINGLRFNAVTDIRKLRLQLTLEINKNIPALDIIVDPKMEPFNDIQAKLLRQILLAGLGDQIAKKVSLEEANQFKEKAKYKYAYKANSMEDFVFLHQNSVLKKTLPEFVIFQEIYETDKIYMRGVSAIDPEWLPTFVPELCNLSEPLLDPPPFYNEKEGSIYCTVRGTFGTQAWTLPEVKIPHPHNVDCIKWFAKYLLEGKVFKKLEKYSKDLLSQPSIMVKTWARLQPRSELLFKALLAKNIARRSNLMKIWMEDRQYLLYEYLKWVPESAHQEVSLMWPPTD
ncbi:probable ATP-dependent RNA helicase kurz [Sitophilus oryzae]|uniref:RNA helicase n=1 Tax=Sitophilus oryzae TaxID=7048 RepID=A0A6J2XAB2_SITOR|nr:probable ATP-dependent RNA helicase kurz [Sitophilus oryzae]